MSSTEPQAANRQRTGMISVIMPCFNAEPFLRQAVESALGQSYGNLELIVVDDGSTDSSREILRSYGDRVQVIQQQRRGPYPARNRGVAASRGEYVAFLDADDYWTRECLAELQNALQGTNAALTYCGWQNVGLAGSRGEPFIPPDYDAGDKLEMFLRSAAPWPIHAALLRKSVWEEVGGFDEDLGTCMDYDLWLRVAVSRPIRRVERVMAFYRHHDQGQITSLQWRQARNAWLVKRKFVREHPAAVQGLGRDRLKELVDGGLLRRGFDAYWRRDLVSARRIFRMALRIGGWQTKDLKYLLPALLPERMYLALVARADGGAKRGA
jgi:glycosyltransferase involved in cell wall biosynthesis